MHFLLLSIAQTLFTVSARRFGPEYDPMLEVYYEAEITSTVRVQIRMINTECYSPAKRSVHHAELTVMRFIEQMNLSK